jgi:hypothetical protein
MLEFLLIKTLINSYEELNSCKAAIKAKKATGAARASAAH